MDATAELFDLFWENSKFSDATMAGFSKQLENYSGAEHSVAALQYATPDIALPLPRDTLQTLLGRRRSQRSFADKALSMTQLGSLLAAFTSSGGAKVFPSAGATFPLEVFCIVHKGQGALDTKICYYNSDTHSVSVTGNAPSWDEYGNLLNIDLEGTVPAVVFVFVLFPDRIVSKYGERGGRFALIEVGHAVQNLALRVAEEKLAGVPIGGLVDDKIKRLLGLERTNALIALGYACGHPKRTTKKV